MSVEVPGPKLDRISELLKKFLLSNSHKAREITSVLGKLNALEPALGKAVFVGTLLATMAVIVATEVSEAEIRWKSPWGGGEGADSRRRCYFVPLRSRTAAEDEEWTPN
jgi:hypothetical protein